jgi:SAM-dependent methyltransferase
VSSHDRTVEPPAVRRGKPEARDRLRNGFYHGAGLVFLLLAKAKSVLRGYRTPRPFPVSQFERSLAYDLAVVRKWRRFLTEYTGDPGRLHDRAVLELGPGADLGTGLLLLAGGAARYQAVDVHALAGSAPGRFYELLLDHVRADAPQNDPAELRRQLSLALRGRGERLRYTCREDFDLTAACAPASIDLVFSQAAFEHFDDVERTIRQLSEVCRAGAVLITEVDLRTHSRWIRQRDPNNIYRYGDRLYRLFSFRGSPNRLRPRDYLAALARYGWERLEAIPLEAIDAAALAQVLSGLQPRFRSDACQMDALSVMICATRS